MTTSPTPQPPPHPVNCARPERAARTGTRGECHPGCASRWTDTDTDEPTNPAPVLMLAFIPTTANTAREQTRAIGALLTHHLARGDIASWYLDDIDVSYPLTDLAGTDPVVTGAPPSGWVDELGLLYRAAWPTDAAGPRFLRDILARDTDPHLLTSIRAVPIRIEPPIPDPHTPTARCQCDHPGSEHDPDTGGCTHAYIAGVLCDCFAFRTPQPSSPR